MFNCLLCKSELNIKECDYKYIYCESKVCDQHLVKYLFDATKQLIYVTYAVYYDEKIYHIYIYDDIIDIHYLNGIHSSQVYQCTLQQSFQLLITPYNYKTKLPMILTYA